jgi:hypothetical protein
MNKYEQLTKDLRESYFKAVEASTNDDGGTANLDSTFLTLKGWQEEKVLKAIENAGLHCLGKTHWLGNGYMINTGGGQGNNRSRMRDAFAKALREKGYDVLHFDKMD